MAKRLKKNYISVLSRCTPKQRFPINKGANNGLIDTICDCIGNVLAGHVPLSPKQRKGIAKHKTILRAIRASKSASAKRKKLIPKCGFLPALLSPLLGIVDGLVTDLILKG